MNWYLDIGQDHQFLYWMERPTYTFQNRRGEAAHKILYKYNKDPIWKPISIELPTRPLTNIENWLKRQDTINLIFSLYNQDNIILEQWIIEEAHISSNITRRSRIVINDVINLIIEYSRAQRLR